MYLLAASDEQGPASIPNKVFEASSKISYFSHKMKNRTCFQMLGGNLQVVLVWKNFCRYLESSWLQHIWLSKGESSCEPSNCGEQLSTNCSSPQGKTSLTLTGDESCSEVEFEICTMYIRQYLGMEKLQIQTKWKPVVAFAQYARMLTRCLWFCFGWHFLQRDICAFIIGHL